MQLLKRGRQIGQAVKNAQRLRQITATLARNGFVDIVERTGLSRFLPKRLQAFAESQSDLSIPERLRLTFEQLGPTFVKLGQLLSTRPDLIPEPFIEEFIKLQDNVSPLAFEIVKGVVESELGRPLHDCFATFEEKPLAAASIGQVHAATLKTGERVVVKVQRPEIQKIIDVDISLLTFIAGLLEKYIPETKIVGPKVIVDEFFRTLSYELDYVIESNNIARIAVNMATVEGVVLPKVYKNLSTQKVLTLERFEGIAFNNLAALDKAGVDRKKIVEIGARAFFKSVMIDGIFHGDLHGGNLFVLPDNRIGIIDFGIVGRLSEKSRDQLASMVVALLNEDFEKLCYYYAELGGAGPAIDFEGFEREVRNTLSPYMGLSLGDINNGRILIEATKIATRYQIKVPGDWMLVFKAILTMEGMGRTLDPTFDLISIGQDLVKDLVKNQVSLQKVSKEMLWISKDFASLLQMVPRQIRWWFRRWSANDFAFEIKSPDLERVREQLDLNGRRQSLSLLIVGFFVSASMVIEHSGGLRIGEYPAISVVFYGLGVLFLLKLLLKSFK